MPDYRPKSVLKNNFSYHTIATNTTLDIPQNQQMIVCDTFNVFGIFNLPGNSQLMIRC